MREDWTEQRRLGLSLAGQSKFGRVGPYHWLQQPEKKHTCGVQVATRKRDIQDFSGFTYPEEDKVANLLVMLTISATLLFKA